MLGQMVPVPVLRRGTVLAPSSAALPFLLLSLPSIEVLGQEFV
jgi:hypothetical protein